MCPLRASSGLSRQLAIVAVARPAATRSGLSLVELLVAMATLAIIAATLAGLANGAHQSWTYTQQQGTSTQHARVVLHRIAETVAAAASTPTISGVAVVYEDVGSWRFYNTLVVWLTPTNPDGPPLVQDCVIICPDPADPTQLVEITAPGDTRTLTVTDAAINQPSQKAVIDDVKTSPTSQKTVLTDRLRAPVVSGTNVRRGAIHFVSEERPTDSEIDDYNNGLIAWSDMSWPRDRYGTQTGLRQYRLRIELQLMPTADDGKDDTNTHRATGYFGSASHGYRIDRTAG